MGCIGLKSIEIIQVKQLPNVISELVVESISEGFRHIKRLKDEFHEGLRDAKSMVQLGKEILEDAGISSIDYLEICDPETLVSKEVADSGDLVAVAVRLDGARLIDNIRL